MRLVVDLQHLLGADVSVPLRRRKGSVAEQLLDRAEVGAAVQEVRGEGMPEAVRRNPVLHGALGETRGEDPPHASIGEARAFLADEDRVDPFPGGDCLRPAARGEVVLERCFRLLSEEDVPLLAPLAEDEDRPLREIEILEIERDQLADAHPRRVEKLEEGAIALTLERRRLGSLEENLDLALAEEARELRL